ncbi:MAG: PAS domain S-box protein, partial [Candidatus Marinimicrobia bacterium]|nr:PAS domain S-box protein [Candidatus Neomarinimicrobiota bacterium]
NLTIKMQNSEIYRQLFLDAQEAMLVVNFQDLRIIDSNVQLSDMLNYEPESLKKISLSEIVAESDWPQLKNLINNKLPEINVLEYSVSLVNIQDELIPTEIRLSLTGINSQQMLQIGVKKIVHKPAIQDMPLFKNAVESVNECIIITDLNGQILFVNKAFEETYGYTREEIQGQDISTIQQGDGQLGLDERNFSLQVVEDWTGEVTHQRKSGARFPASVSTSVIKDEKDEPFAIVSVSKDITRQKNIEEELVKAEKLESLGILAGGIAHDFNNLLTAVIGNISLAKSYLSNTEKMESILNRTEESAVKASRLTAQLLTFSRGGEPIREKISVRSVVEEALNFSLSGSNVASVVQISENIYPVHADKSLLSQAFQNIILNAVHAMNRGGTIQVFTENVTMDQSNRIPGLEGRYYVRVDFKDEGSGISAKNLDKIFDPFFSTKKHSSGLGLATTYSIVKKHNGMITVDSIEGKGSTFSVYLPAIIKKEESEENGGFYREAAEGGRILIMDDEESIRDVCSQMLEHLGYEVETAVDGSEAIRKYLNAKSSGNPIQLVIMDLTIPGGMGGEEAIRQLRELDSDVRAVVSSGYSNSPIMANYRDYGFNGVISKPYQIDDLKSVVARLI